MPLHFIIPHTVSLSSSVCLVASADTPASFFLSSDQKKQREREMASRSYVTGFALFTFVFAVISSLASAQSLAPAPAPTSDGKYLLPRYHIPFLFSLSLSVQIWIRECFFFNSPGTSIDQGIAYLLMVVALVLTYLIHPLDASSSYSFFWFVSSFSVFLFFFVWIKFPSMVINLLMIYVFLSWLWSWIRDDDDSWRLNLCCFPSDYDDDDDDSFSSIFNLFIYYSFLPYIINFEPKRKKKTNPILVQVCGLPEKSEKFKIKSRNFLPLYSISFELFLWKRLLHYTLWVIS